MAYSVNDLLEVRNVMVDAHDGAVNVMHFKVHTVTTGGAGDQETANIIANIFKPVYLALTATTVEWRYSSHRRVWPLPKTPEIQSDIAVGSGTATGDQLPGQTCGIITLRTGLAGVKNRGRQYIPFPAESANGSDGLPNAAYQALLAPLRTIIINDITVAGISGGYVLRPVIYHAAAHTSDDVTSGVLRDYWGTQRRRVNRRF